MENKQRHGCVTAWLILMIIANAVTSLSYLFLGENFTAELRVPIAIIGMVNVFFAVMLFLWKRWAFYGFLVMSLVIFVINLSMGYGIAQSLFGLVGMAILYMVLQIKQDNVSAWHQLK